MPRIFIPIPSIKEDRISITGDKARYLSTVLRCKKGDELIVFEGKGNCLRTNIIETKKREVVLEVLEKISCNTEAPIRIILVQGLLKGQKMDLVVQKTTELGVKEIIPLITERSQARETRKVERWQKITEEASRQFGRSVVPVIRKPKEFDQFLSGVQLERKGERETRRDQWFYFLGRRGNAFKRSNFKSFFLTVLPVPRFSLLLFNRPRGWFCKGRSFFLLKKKDLLLPLSGKEFSKQKLQRSRL